MATMRWNNYVTKSRHRSEHCFTLICPQTVDSFKQMKACFQCAFKAFLWSFDPQWEYIYFEDSISFISCRWVRTFKRDFLYAVRICFSFTILVGKTEKGRMLLLFISFHKSAYANSTQATYIPMSQYSSLPLQHCVITTKITRYYVLICC